MIYWLKKKLYFVFWNFRFNNASNHLGLHVQSSREKQGDGSSWWQFINNSTERRIHPQIPPRSSQGSFPSS